MHKLCKSKSNKTKLTEAQEAQLLYGSEGSIIQLYHSQYYTTISSC